MGSFAEIFAIVPDPRDATAQHDLGEILFIALLAALAGANDCTAFAAFGRAKEGLLRQFLTLKHGIPSHDTFNRVFRRLDPVAFGEAFGRFVAAFAAAAGHAAPRGVVALDGKSLRCAYEAGQAHMPKMMVSAWGAETRLVLAQTEAPGGNEVEAVLGLVRLVSLEGCIVTADALHCHRAMARAVRKAGADYALKLKRNQPALLADAVAALGRLRRPARAETCETAHGRTERRTATVAAAPGLAQKHRFAGLCAVARIEATRTVSGKTSSHVYHVLLSRLLSPADVLATVREQWEIENKVHWPLDVVFREDLCRTRKDNGPRNLAVLRHLSLNVLRAHPDKSSISIKRQRAGWDNAFLLDLMTHVR
jgi:predicted transposase YbfD/YdcC